jgi:hypothetical protein
LTGGITKTPDGKKILGIASPASSPRSLGRPKGSITGSGGKYGRCPDCETGRRERSRFNPFGRSPHAGKFRFVCSNRRGNPPCNYSEVSEEFRLVLIFIRV